MANLYGQLMIFYWKEFLRYNVRGIRTRVQHPIDFGRSFGFRCSPVADTRQYIVVCDSIDLYFINSSTCSNGSSSSNRHRGRCRSVVSSPYFVCYCFPKRVFKRHRSNHSRTTASRPNTVDTAAASFLTV